MVQSSGFPTRNGRPPIPTKTLVNLMQHWTKLSVPITKELWKPWLPKPPSMQDGVTHSLVFTPHLEVFHTGKLLVPGIEIKMKFHFNSPSPVFEWSGSGGSIDGRRCQTAVSSLPTAFE